MRKAAVGVFERIVIVHPEHGVYLGSFLGLGFFSALGSAGQATATVFADENQATTHIASWQSESGNLRLVRLQTRHDMFATVRELEAAGLGDMLGDMPIEALRQATVAGRA